MKTRDELPALFAARGYQMAVEVGVLRGEFSRVILAGWGGMLVMVDAWRHLDGYADVTNVSDAMQEENLRAAEAVANAFPGRGKILRGLSVEMAKEFEDASVDAVYIDANHSKDAVLADLSAWVPKVRPGGVVAGHDYLDGYLSQGVFGVRSAVLEFFGHEPDIVTGEPWPSWLVEIV